MPRSCTAVLVLFALSLPSGCRRETDPPPRYLAMSGKLIPVRIPQHVLDQSRDKSVLGSAARPDEAAPAGPNARGETPGAIEIDDSTADGVVHAYVEMMATGQLSRMADILVPEQQERARQMVRAMRPMLDAEAELTRAWEDKFPGHPVQFGQSGGAVGQMKLTKPYTVVEVNVQSGSNEGEATLEEQDGSQTALALRQIDGRWRIEDSTLPSAEELEQMAPMLTVFAGMAKVMQDVAGKITSGEITDVEEAREALGEAMSGGGPGPAVGEEPPGDEESDEEEPIVEEPADERESPAKSTAKPARERDAVDEAYSGPGMLRDR